MKTVFVIMASQGEYSDRNEWPVLVVTDETVAQEKVLELSKNWEFEAAKSKYISTYYLEPEYSHEIKLLNSLPHEEPEAFGILVDNLTQKRSEKTKNMTLEQLKVSLDIKYLEEISYYYSKCELYE